MNDYITPEQRTDLLCIAMNLPYKAGDKWHTVISTYFSQAERAGVGRCLDAAKEVAETLVEMGQGEKAKGAHAVYLALLPIATEDKP